MLKAIKFTIAQLLMATALVGVVIGYLRFIAANEDRFSSLAVATSIATLLLALGGLSAY